MRYEKAAAFHGLCLCKIFGSPDLGLELAHPGTFSLRPSKEMVGDLRRDYDRMAGMIIGEIPRFGAVMESVGTLESCINESV